MPLHLAPLHLAVALDGAGWHPAAWRMEAARPAELLTARYWADLVGEAERGLVDFVTIEDSLGLQSLIRRRATTGPTRYGDGSTLCWSPLRSLRSPARIGLVPSVVATHTEPFHISKAIATLDYASNGPGGGAGPGLGATGRGAPFRPPVTRLELDAEPPESWLPTLGGGRRLRRGGAPPLGQLGGRRRDPRRRLGAVHRQDEASLHRLPGPVVQRKRPSITPRPPQGQPVVSALAHGPAAYRLHRAGGRRRLRHPQDRGHAVRSWRLSGRNRRLAAEPRKRSHVLADLVVFLDNDPGGSGRPEELTSTSLAGEEYHERRCHFRRAPAQLADLLQEWQRAGLSGFPAPARGGLPGPGSDHARRSCPSCSAVACSAGRTRQARCGDCSAWPGPPTVTRPVVSRQHGWTRPRKQVHLAAHFPGVNNTTVWSDPRSGSHIEFASFVHFAQTAERAKFDFMFLAEGLRLREHGGQIYDLDVVGRPDTFTVLAALAAVTDRLGLAGTINSTFNEPYEVARQFATLDHLSGGRAAWNVVTSWDAFTGENFRRGGYLPEDQRYARAQQFLQTACELFDSWRGDEVRGRQGVRGLPALRRRRGVRAPRRVLRYRRSVQRSPQPPGPAGDIPGGGFRTRAGSSPPPPLTPFSAVTAPSSGQAFYADIKGRLARYGRSPGELLILPAATFVLGATDAEANEYASEVRRQQVSGQTAIKFLEQAWNRDLSAYDPDGPLPDVDPQVGGQTIAQGRASVRSTVTPWPRRGSGGRVPQAEHLSIRDLVIAVSARRPSSVRPPPWPPK